MRTERQIARTKLLIEALRSGKYKQGRNQLCYKGKYCCLGVACEVAVENGCSVHVHIYEHCGVTARRYNRYVQYMPEVVADFYGFRSQQGNYGGTSLLDNNDTDEFSFEQIADIIESAPEGLFV